MHPILITQDLESLKKATEVLDKIFLESKVPIEIQNEWTKWNKWFLKQKEAFIQGKTTIPKYFAQIKRIQEFILENTPLKEENLFQMSLVKRERVYDITKLTHEKPEALPTSEKEFLIKSIYENLVKSPSDLKNNPTIESMVTKKMEKRFGRKLPEDLNLEAERLMTSKNIQKEDDDYFIQLGEIFLELGKLDQAKSIINNVSNDKTRFSLLTWTSFLENDYSAFKKNIQKAYPETFEPQTKGPYILSFLLGNEKNYKLILDEKGNRTLEYTFTTGIYQIRQMDVFRSFLDDLRQSPDFRLGMWIRPTTIKTQNIAKDISQLYFKQVIGWKDISV